MKVILTHEVSSLGSAGDVVEVKAGYARNFLFRRGLATAWTKGGQKQVDAIAKGRETRAVKSLEEAKSFKAILDSGDYEACLERLLERTGYETLVRRREEARKEGRLFGAVSTADIAAAVAAAGGPALDKRKIELPTPIKTLGSHEALVRLHPEVQAKVALNVVSA